MAPGSQQEEENWDDDFEFGSSAGSPVLGRRGDVTPPNLSPRAIARSSLAHASNGNGLRTPPNAKNRWSSGSIENWDDEDETVNLKSLGSGLPQQPVTPEAQAKPQNRTPTRTRNFSEDSAAFWDDDEDIDLAKSARPIPPSKSFTPPASTSRAPHANGTSPTADESPYLHRSNITPSNLPTTFPSAAKPDEPNGFGTDGSITNADTMDSSDSSALAQSDTSASASASQSSSFFGRLGRRLSKVGSSRNGTLSPSATEEMPSSTFPSAIFSPPASSNNLAPNSANSSYMLGSSPSKSRTGFSFGGSMLKRSGSLSKSSHSGNPPGLPARGDGVRRNKAAGEGPSPGSEVGLGLGMPMPNSRNGATSPSHTAPATFNARRYTERIVDVPYSSSTQHAPLAHGHSHSVADMPRNIAPGWGAPPSPTRNGKSMQLGSSGGVEMLTSPSFRSKLQSQGPTLKPSTSSAEGSKPTHHQSASVSGAFFSSMRRRSNPLQAASKVPNSAMTGIPPAPPPKSALPRDDLPPAPISSALNENKRLKEDGPPQTSSQAQIQAQRQRRTHRRNVSTGAMITSVIDEVSSDGTVNNKLSAGAMRERQPVQRSGLSQSTTASEIRRAGKSTPPPRTSTSSDGASLPLVSPIVFGRGSEDSGSGGRRSSESAFFLPPSMSIRSPALPTSGIRADTGNGGRRNGDWSPSSSPGDKPIGGLLPPIELCPPSPPEAQSIKPSQSSTAGRRQEALTYTPDAVDDDKTPMAPPRRRVHHLQIGTGTIVPVSSLSKSSQLDAPKYETSQGGLTTSTSTPLSISSAGSNKTLAPKQPATNKHIEAANGRTSPGISASLGRLAGASTAGKIDEQLPGVTGSNGIARRNSLSGGVISGTLSTTSSMGGGLKIPARISAKQDALKRDLSAVREFALSIDELKRLQFSYELVLFEVKRLCRPSRSPPAEFRPKQWYRTRTASPIPQFHLPHAPSRPESDDQPQPSTPISPTFDKPPDNRRRHIIRVPDKPTVKDEPIDESSFIPAEQKEVTTAAVAELDTHYSIWWECADLLIELGGAAPPVVAGTAVKSPTMPALRKPGLSVFDNQSTPRANGRHATLPTHAHHPDGSITDLSKVASPDSSNSSSLRRGSTGQQDLNARQLHLLKGMLSTPNPNDLSSSVDFGSLYSMESQALSPVISNPASTVRNPSGVADEDVDVWGGKEAQVLTEREKKRNRRVSLAGKLGVREILAGLKWTKEKAKQRYKQPLPTPSATSRSSVDFEGPASRRSVDQSSPRFAMEEVTRRGEGGAGQSRDNVNVASPARPGDPPSPYKRNRRRSLASIFKFGNTSGNQIDDRTVSRRSISRSRSRVDLTSPLTVGGYSNNHNASSRADDSMSPDADSDWDQLSSPSDMAGRYPTSLHTRSSAQDLSAALNRGRTAPVGVPISNSSRRGSSRNPSASRNTFNSASASSASLVSSSVYGSAASQASLHEPFGGRGLVNRNEEDRRRLKKPSSKQPRRPPSAGARKSQPPSSQGYSPGKNTSSTPPGFKSPMLDRPYYSTRSASHQSPNLPEISTHPYPSLSTRSAPMHGVSTSSVTDLSQPRLALTPENIIPLLVYAREVKLKLADCLIELKSLETDLLMSKVGGEYLDNNGAVEFIPDDSEW